MDCHFGCKVKHSTQLTLIHYPDGCWCFPDREQWLCPQHAIKGLQNNHGYTVRGYLHNDPVSR